MTPADAQENLNSILADNNCDIGVDADIAFVFSEPKRKEGLFLG